MSPWLLSVNCSTWAKTLPAVDIDKPGGVEQVRKGQAEIHASRVLNSSAPCCVVRHSTLNTKFNLSFEYCVSGIELFAQVLVGHYPSRGIAITAHYNAV